MLRHTSLVGAAVVGIATLLAPGAGAQAGGPCRAEYWVSPDGNDASSGDRAGPFRTLARARDAVRADERRGQCDIVVNIRGEHRLDAPLVLEAQDSGASGHAVVYRAAPGERAVLSGANRAEGWTPNAAVYAATKAAVEAITGVVAKGPRKIRVNAISPGMIATESSREGGFVGGDFQKMVETQAPLGRIGEPGDSAPTAVYLASSDSKYVTGETLLVSGGLK